MGDKHNVDSADESEFGLGEGMIDQVQRANRTLSAEQELLEIYALPKTFDQSAKGLPGGVRPTQAETPVPRGSDA